ncbi:MAG TPA: hypothetical protein VHD36_23965 [Pirellulales bacterium]|nr:hypothetical protein [Pirellulales bacterium]
MLGYIRPTRLLPLLAALLVAPGGLSGVRAEEISLTSGRTPGETSHVEVLLEVGGELLVKDEKEQKAHPLKTSVVGTMVYDERLANAATPAATRGVRNYRRCDAVIKIDKGSTKARLRDDRRLMVVAADERTATLFCPLAPISQDELDLIRVPACSLIVERLLPDRPVSPGDQWQHSEDLLVALLNLDAISHSEVTTTFKQVTDSAAQLELAGTVKGAIEGASTEIELKGRYKFDLQSKRVTWLALLVKEKRSIGSIAPGVDVTARLQMKIAPGATSEALSDTALATIPLEPSAEQALLEYTSAGGNFQFLHDRGWHVVSEKPDAVTLRLMERGELIAQCNASGLPVVEAGKRFTLARFQEDVQKSLGDHFKQFVSAGESKNSLGQATCRVIANGEVESLPIQWNYYLVADDQGHQAVLAFTLESELVDRFGESDKAILSTLRLVSPPVDTAAQPTPAPPRR